MPFAKKMLSDCKQSLADRHDRGVLPKSSITLSFYTRLLNRGINYCADRLRMEKSTSLTTASGTIALPDDFLKINRVYNASNTEYSLCDKDDKASQTGTTYWITGNQTDGFSLNTPTDETYTVHYSFRPTEMSSDSDVCVIPDIEAVVAYAYAMIRKGESDPFEDADAALQECDSRLNEMQSAQNINNNFTGFQINDGGVTDSIAWD